VVFLLAVALVLLGSGVASAAVDDPWMMRTRLIGVLPNDSGTDELDEVSVSTNLTVEVDFTRFLTERLALELVVATTGHSLKIEDFSIGSVGLIPPTLTLQYHFAPDGSARPYIGVGVNYTIFYQQSGLLDDLDLKNSFGWDGQFGVDFTVGKGVLLNLDIKYINVETDVSIDGMDLGKVKINPWVIGFGVGHRW
jgi:outer membrane protein